jgi:hypothetical protein
LNNLEAVNYDKYSTKLIKRDDQNF